MIVITVTNCPRSLRGDLTLWLQEIDTGVFVGRVSARVREELWARVNENIINGSATLTFGTNNEQGYTFTTLNTNRKVLTHGGVTLVQIPRDDEREIVSKNKGYSKASKMMKAKNSSKYKKGVNLPDEYVILDIETTGTNKNQDEIIEIGALFVSKNIVIDTFNAYTKIKGKIPDKISEMTGIDYSVIKSKGVDLVVALKDIKEFIGNKPIVGHKIIFDVDFLNKAFTANNMGTISNFYIDTSALVKKIEPKLSSYTLEFLARYYEINVEKFHRGLCDCYTTFDLIQKLNEKEQN